MFEEIKILKKNPTNHNYKPIHRENQQRTNPESLLFTVSTKPLKEIARNIESVCAIKDEQYKKLFNQNARCKDGVLDNQCVW